MLLAPELPGNHPRLGIPSLHRLVRLEYQTVSSTWKGETSTAAGMVPIYQCMSTGAQRAYGGPLTTRREALAELYGPNALDWKSDTMAVLR